MNAFHQVIDKQKVIGELEYIATIEELEDKIALDGGETVVGL